MPRLAQLQSRIHSLEELGDVVGALRAVSATRVQQAHAVLESIRQYTEVIHEALAEALRALPPPPNPSDPSPSASLIIAFGSEHGFVGGFNDRVLDAVATRRKPGDELIVVGTRADLVARERREAVTWSCAMAAQVAGIDEVGLRLMERIAVASGRRRVDRVTLVYMRVANGPAARAITETLLPFDVKSIPHAGALRPKAISNLAPLVLLDGLVDELLFAQLAHAATESFASENTARLAAMQAATDNVTTKLDDLARIERELRQEEITTELLDVVTGAEAVREGG
jgi:F-type H+-transporting ATPase subunit gamma